MADPVPAAPPRRSRRCCSPWLLTFSADWAAWRLPKRIALWAFIRVYAKDGHSPGPDYKRVYDAWESNGCEASPEEQGR